MMKPLGATVIAAAIFINGHAMAAQKSVTLAVDGMTCASCPYIVKQTLAVVSGVNTVEVFFKEKKAIVTFDDAKTNISALTAATTNVGFPSRLIK